MFTVDQQITAEKHDTKSCLDYKDFSMTSIIRVGDQHHARGEAAGRGEPGPAHPRPHGADGDRRPAQVPAQPETRRR